MALYVNKGRGFMPAEQHVLPKSSPVDLVRVDSIYNPVLRANFTVDETRVGQRTDFDRLTLVVETNGSVSPEESVGYAAELARKHLEYMLRFAEPLSDSPPVPGAVRVPSPLRDLFRRPIDELAELSVRSVNSLKKENIITLGDLVQRTEDQMLNIENFGIKSLEEIRQFLNEHNLHFGMKLEASEDGEMYLVEQKGNGGVSTSSSNAFSSPVAEAEVGPPSSRESEQE
jgi:DNA-directed RNA polymerase subunit alpha